MKIRANETFTDVITRMTGNGWTLDGITEENGKREAKLHKEKTDVSRDPFGNVTGTGTALDIKVVTEFEDGELEIF